MSATTDRASGKLWPVPVKSNGVLKLQTTEDSLLLHLSKMRVSFLSSFLSFFFGKTPLTWTPTTGTPNFGNLHMPDKSKALLKLENKKDLLLSILFGFFHNKTSRSCPLLLVLAVTVSSPSIVFGCHGLVRFYLFWLSRSRRGQQKQ